MTSGGRELSIEAKFEEKRRAWEDRESLPSTSHSIYLGDARSMADLGSDPSVHLVVTSPPYWNLKEYPELKERQLGNLPEYQHFLEQLTSVWRRCYELLVPGGRLCIVVGDVCLSREYQRTEINELD